MTIRDEMNANFCLEHHFGVSSLIRVGGGCLNVVGEQSLGKTRISIGMSGRRDFQNATNALLPIRNNLAAATRTSV